MNKDIAALQSLKSAILVMQSETVLDVLELVNLHINLRQNGMIPGVPEECIVELEEETRDKQGL